MTTKEPYSWLRYIEKALIDLDELPLLGHVPPFDWKNLVDRMKDLLQIPDLVIEPHNWSWKTQEGLFENLGDDCACLNIAVLPLQSHASLLMSANSSIPPPVQGMPSILCGLSNPITCISEPLFM